MVCDRGEGHRRGLSLATCERLFNNLLTLRERQNMKSTSDTFTEE